MIDRHDSAQGFSIGQVNQGRIGEIHRPIMISSHQAVQLRHVGVIDRSQSYRSGTQELPGRRHFSAVIAYQMKQLGQYRDRSCQRQGESRESFGTRPMPTIVSIEQSENRACINETVGEHVDWQVACGSQRGLVQSGGGCLRAAHRSTWRRPDAVAFVPPRPRRSNVPVPSSTPRRCGQEAPQRSGLRAAPLSPGRSSSRRTRANCRPEFSPLHYNVVHEPVKVNAVRKLPLAGCFCHRRSFSSRKSFFPHPARPRLRTETRSVHLPLTSLATAAGLSQIWSAPD